MIMKKTIMMKMTGRKPDPLLARCCSRCPAWLAVRCASSGDRLIVLMIWSAPAVIPPPKSPVLKCGRIASRMIMLDTASVRNTRAP